MLHSKHLHKAALRSLGLRHQFLCCRRPSSQLPHTHYCQQLEKPGDKHIVDVGLCCPSFEPLPLDFEDQSPIYKQSFSVFKYVRKEGKYIRYHKTGSKNYDLAPDIRREDEIKWKGFYAMDDKVIPRELSFFDQIMDEVYTDLDSVITPFHKSLRAVAYHGEGADLRLVAVKDSSLLLENESRQINEEKLGSVEELLERVDLYFPPLSAEAREAVKNVEWNF